MNKKFVVRDTEAGNVIEYVDSIEEGLQLISTFENSDKEEGIYVPDFYECSEI